MHSKKLITQDNGIPSSPHSPLAVLVSSWWSETGEKPKRISHVGVSECFRACHHKASLSFFLFFFFLLAFVSPHLSLRFSLIAIPPSIFRMVPNSAPMHRRNPTLDLPSPRIDFDVPEPYSPRFFPPSSSSKLSRPRFTVTHSLISRQWLQRTTFLALFSLFSVSVYILLVNGSSNLRPVAIPQQIKSPFQAAMNTVAHSTGRPWRPTHKDLLASRPQITLTPEEELAALSSFIFSLPDQNVLPSSVDPHQPIDPQLILDFDTRRDGAKAELKRLVTSTWENHPVVMYTKVSTLSLD